MKAKRVKKLDPAAPLGENAARIVRTRLSELTALAPRALRRSEVTAQHDMRIAAKRLRYVLELTGFCFGGPADTARRRARELQDVLGEIHDCDVMLPRVREHLAATQAEDAAAVRAEAGRAADLDPQLAAEAPNRSAYRGLDVLAVHLLARRELLFDRFVALWERQQRAGTWVRLENAVGEELGRAKRARRAAKAARKAPSSRVLFVCLHNAGRSQISRALFERAAGGRHAARSAGTTPADRVHPEVVEAMSELGIDLAAVEPRKLDDELAQWADVLVTMGCGEECPVTPGVRHLDWDLPDPKGRPLEEVRRIRDEIGRRVRELAAELG